MPLLHSFQMIRAFSLMCKASNPLQKVGRKHKVAKVFNRTLCSANDAEKVSHEYIVASISSEDSPYFTSDSQCPPPSLRPGFTRRSFRQIPENMSLLTRASGSQVYIVGSVHSSHDSRRQVLKTIKSLQPDFVFLELCAGRFKDIDKASEDKDGGEFVVAVKQAALIPGCTLILGDRPFEITIRRVVFNLHSVVDVLILPFRWLRVAFKPEEANRFMDAMKKLKSNQKLSNEEVNLIMSVNSSVFPSMHQVLVKERDLYLAKTLYNSAKVLRDETTGREVPSVTVAVVGRAHVKGINQLWPDIEYINVESIAS